MSEHRQYVKPIDRPNKTPYLELNLDKVKDAYDRLHKYLPDIEIFYAMKCNPNPEIMKTVLNCGGQFEISSANEMIKAINVGADPKDILFSNPIKTLDDIKYTHQMGVKYFAFDSFSEVDKLAEGAPGASVYVRISIPVRKSAVASEGKFGVPIEQAKELVIYAKERGLKPYGISFHVGSQMLDYKSWGYAIQHSGKLMKALEDSGILLQFLDIGGGFPVCYDDIQRDNLDKTSHSIVKAIEKYIPKGTRVIAEPGRFLVADAGTMVSSVMGMADRSGRKWLHLDVGAHNGFMESLQTANTLAFPVHDSKHTKDKDVFTLTGPTCDSQDTILFDVLVSSNIEVGDKIYFECAGAYTTAFTEKFNGFPNPETYVVDKQKG
jgi:ornithine decarboxylase